MVFAKPSFGDFGCRTRALRCALVTTALSLCTPNSVRQVLKSQEWCDQALLALLLPNFTFGFLSGIAASARLSAYFYNTEDQGLDKFHSQRIRFDHLLQSPTISCLKQAFQPYPFCFRKRLMLQWTLWRLPLSSSLEVPSPAETSEIENRNRQEKVKQEHWTLQWQRCWTCEGVTMRCPILSNGKGTRGHETRVWNPETEPKGAKKEGTSVGFEIVKLSRSDEKWAGRENCPLLWLKGNAATTRATQLIKMGKALLSISACTHLYIHTASHLQVHGSLARAGKVKNQTPKVAKAEKKKATGCLGLGDPSQDAAMHFARSWPDVPRSASSTTDDSWVPVP